MNLRHIDPRSSDWMDAMMEGEGGRSRKRGEPQEESAAAEPSENPALLLGAEAERAPQRPSPHVRR